MNKKYPHYQAGGPLTVQQRALKKVERDVRRDDPVTFEEGVKSLAPEMLSRDDLKSRLRDLMEEKAKRLRAEDEIKLEDETVDDLTLLEKLRSIPSRVRGGVSDLLENYRTHPDTLRDQERLRQTLIPPHIRESLPEGTSVGMPTPDDRRPDRTDSSVERLKYLNLPAHIREAMPFERLNMASGGILGFQTGGAPPDTRRSRGYRPRALPQGYGGMSGYAGYGMPGEMTQQRSYVAPELASQWADITGGIMQAGTRKYDDIRYKGPRLAGFTPEEAAYKAAVTSIGTGQGPQATRQAEQTLGDAATAIGGVATAAGAPSLLKDADLSKYESQYTQGVIDPQIRAIREAAKQRAAEMGSTAAQAGAFGGYRHGLQEQAIGQQEMEQIGDVTAKGYEQAFRSAQEAQQKDAAAEAAARAQQFGAYGQLTGIAGQEAALGSQQQRDEMARLQAMREAGTDTRKMQQAAYDMQRAEHERAMAYPEQQLSWMSNILSQTPYQNITTEGTYAPSAGPMGTMIGAYGTGQGQLNQMGSGAGMPPAGTPPAGTPPYLAPITTLGNPNLTPGVGTANTAGMTLNLNTGGPLAYYGGGSMGLPSIGNAALVNMGGGAMPRYGRP